MLVHSLRGRDVRWLFCAGEPLVSDGRLTRVDGSTERDIIAEARARANELLDRTDVPAHRPAAERAALEAIV